VNIMEKMMKECTKPHALAHTFSGVGLGLVIAGLWPSLGGQTGVWLGIALVVVSVVVDFSVNPAKK